MTDDTATPLLHSTQSLGTSGRSEEERLKIIADAIEQLRPRLQADGGDMELASVEGYKVRVKLKGVCASCGMSGETLGGIRRGLIQALGEPVLVLPAR